MVFIAAAGRPGAPRRPRARRVAWRPSARAASPRRSRPPSRRSCRSPAWSRARRGRGRLRAPRHEGRERPGRQLVPVTRLHRDAVDTIAERFELGAVPRGVVEGRDRDSVHHRVVQAEADLTRMQHQAGAEKVRSDRILSVDRADAAHGTGDAEGLYGRQKLVPRRAVADDQESRFGDKARDEAPGLDERAQIRRVRQARHVDRQRMAVDVEGPSKPGQVFGRPRPRVGRHLDLRPIERVRRHEHPIAVETVRDEVPRCTLVVRDDGVCAPCQQVAPASAERRLVPRRVPMTPEHDPEPRAAGSHQRHREVNVAAVPAEDHDVVTSAGRPAPERRHPECRTKGAVGDRDRPYVPERPRCEGTLARKRRGAVHEREGSDAFPESLKERTTIAGQRRLEHQHARGKPGIARRHPG